MDISSLAAFYGTTSYGESTLQVTNGATLLDGDLTTFNTVNVTLDGTGTVATSQWTSLNFDTLTVNKSGSIFTSPTS